MIRFFTLEQFHNKANVGSTKLRVHNLIKYWPEAGIYKYGEKPDVLVFQKVYMSPDYRFHEQFEGLKILDICDPDWLDNLPIKETCDAVDGITCPTQAIADYLAQLTDTPIRVIPDRHDLALVPEPSKHTGKARSAVWFGYKQNAQLLQFAVPTIEQLGLELTVLSNEDPMAFRWATDPETYKSKYKFKKYDPDSIYQDLGKNDICVLPAGNRPVDRFKSNNKTTLAWLAGLPVATDGDGLRLFMDAAERNREVSEKQALAREQYDVMLSVRELKTFIEELQS